MARFEADREDPFAESGALARRVELVGWTGVGQLWAGCRPTGAWSVYFGSEACYHFDPQGRLRRAHVGDRLYRSEGSTLAALTRVRTSDAVVLQRHDLSESECGEFLARCEDRLQNLALQIQQQVVTVARQVPEAGDVAGELLTALEFILAHGIRLAPGFVTRRRH